MLFPPHISLLPLQQEGGEAPPREREERPLNSLERLSSWAVGASGGRPLVVLLPVVQPRR